jgi:Flp pilus assembly secretin CpaC
MSKVLVLIVLLLFVSSVFASEQMIEISVEVTEVNENKIKVLGIKLVDDIITNKSELNIPAILESGFWGTNTKFSAVL